MRWAAHNASFTTKNYVICSLQARMGLGGKVWAEAKSRELKAASSPAPKSIIRNGEIPIMCHEPVAMLHSDAVSLGQ